MTGLGLLKIAISPYQLQPVAPELPPREGFLLRVTHLDSDTPGYADCHPWPELGDDPWPVQVRKLSLGLTTQLLDASLHWAKRDASARLRGIKLGEGLTAPQNHFSSPFSLARADIDRFIADLDRAVANRLKLVKTKIGPGAVADGPANLFREASKALAERGLKVRLDFNARFSHDEATEVIREWGEAAGDLSQIDWIEDPCPFSRDHWQELRDEFKVKIALDIETAPPPERKRRSSFDIIILKPARKVHVRTLPPGAAVAFTCALDHPFGQLCANYAASDWLTRRLTLRGLSTPVILKPDERHMRKVLRGGLAGHFAYQPNEFSERLQIRRGRLVLPDGTGFGFDDLLAARDWKEVWG